MQAGWQSCTTWRPATAPPKSYQGCSHCGCHRSPITSIRSPKRPRSPDLRPTKTDVIALSLSMSVSTASSTDDDSRLNCRLLQAGSCLCAPAIPTDRSWHRRSGRSVRIAGTPTASTQHFGEGRLRGGPQQAFVVCRSPSLGRSAKSCEVGCMGSNMLETNFHYAFPSSDSL